MDSYIVSVPAYFVGENFLFQILFKNLNFGGILARIWAKFATTLCEICQEIHWIAWIFGMGIYFSTKNDDFHELIYVFQH